MKTIAILMLFCGACANASPSEGSRASALQAECDPWEDPDCGFVSDPYGSGASVDIGSDTYWNSYFNGATPVEESCCSSCGSCVVMNSDGTGYTCKAYFVSPGVSREDCGATTL